PAPGESPGHHRGLDLGVVDGPARHHHLRQCGGALSDQQLLCLDGGVLHFPAHCGHHDGRFHGLCPQSAHPHRIHCRRGLPRTSASAGHPGHPVLVAVLHCAHHSVGAHGLRRIHLGGHLPGDRRAHLVVFDLGTRPLDRHQPENGGHPPPPAEDPPIIAAVLFISFPVLLVIGGPVAVALGISGSLAVVLSNLDTQWFGLMTVPQSFYAGLAKYPLLAIPMFVLVGSIFDRSGVAARLVNFAVAIAGRGPGMLPLVTIAVAMFLGGISGSGPACAAAVGAVMIGDMKRAGYPAPYAATIVGAGAATDILMPPSFAFIVYSVLVPAASVPALFAAGLVPGMLVGLALIIPA